MYGVPPTKAQYIPMEDKFELSGSPGNLRDHFV